MGYGMQPQQQTQGFANTMQQQTFGNNMQAQKLPTD